MDTEGRSGLHLNMSVTRWKLLRDLEVRFIDCAENDAIVHQSLQGLPI